MKNTVDYRTTTILRTIEQLNYEYYTKLDGIGIISKHTHWHEASTYGSVLQQHVYVRTYRIY